MKPAIEATTVEANRGNGFPEPFHTTLGDCEWRQLGDHFGLTQFGVNLEHLEPGCQSALRRWHTDSDEFVYMLAGELVLITDEGETIMHPGMIAGFVGGEQNGHHLVNRSESQASFLVIGSRIEGDSAHYPDDDIMWTKDDQGNWKAAYKNGTLYD